LVVEWYLHQLQGAIEHQKVPLRLLLPGEFLGELG
jgi:hypothetical protein